MFPLDSPAAKLLKVNKAHFENLSPGLLPLFYIILRRDISKSPLLRARDTVSNVDIVLPSALQHGINRVSMLLRYNACDYHDWSGRRSDGSRARAVVAAQEARHLQMVFSGIVTGAGKAIKAGTMTAAYRCGILNRVLWRHLLCMGQGMVGRRMFAVLIGVKNYELDILEHGGKWIQSACDDCEPHALADWETFDTFWRSEKKESESGPAYWHLYQTQAWQVAREQWYTNNYRVYDGLDKISTRQQGIFFLGKKTPDFGRDYKEFRSPQPVEYGRVIMSQDWKLQATWRRHHDKLAEVDVSLNHSNTRSEADVAAADQSG
jgi:hypothetical protein